MKNCLAIHHYLLEFIKKDTSYFSKIMTGMSSEDKDSFATYLLTQGLDTLPLRFHVMQAIIDDSSTPLSLKFENRFNLNYEKMAVKIEQLVAKSDQMSFESFCKNKAGFEIYQIFFKAFRDEFLACIKEIGLATLTETNKKMDALEQSFLTRYVGFNQTYQKYKAMHASS